MGEKERDHVEEGKTGITEDRRSLEEEKGMETARRERETRNIISKGKEVSE